VSGFDPSFLLFVPGDRPDRFERALLSAASGAILDLEDAVAAERKERARADVAAFLRAAPDAGRIAVRINGAGTPWFEGDLAMLRGRAIGALVLPKAESPETIDRVQRVLGHSAIVAIVESARGLVAVEAVAAHPLCIALAFGPYDLASDLGGVAEWDEMLPHRARVLVAARAFGRAAIDGPAGALRDRARILDEARRAARLGYDGKLLVHPEQIDPARSAFRPTSEEVARAQRVLAAALHAMPAVVDGAMVDEPMLVAARRTLARAGLGS
jgi:citrate lyase subunit beta / citryl-CoA lyase